VINIPTEQLACIILGEPGQGMDRAASSSAPSSAGLDTEPTTRSSRESIATAKNTVRRWGKRVFWEEGTSGISAVVSMRGPGIIGRYHVAIFGVVRCDEREERRNSREIRSKPHTNHTPKCYAPFLDRLLGREKETLLLVEEGRRGDKMLASLLLLVVVVALSVAIGAQEDLSSAALDYCGEYNTPQCPNKGIPRDLLFLVDGSNSMDPDKFFREMLDYTLSLYCAFDPSVSNQVCFCYYTFDIFTTSVRIYNVAVYH
jgi:hypothetical protein